MNNLLEHISENFSSLSKGHKKIASYVTENTDKAAFMTAGKLASAVGTSEATVIRFVSKLGFSGYAEFQKKMQEVLRGKLNNLQRMEVAFERIGNSDLLRNVMHSDVENIKQTLEHINKEEFDKVADVIANAKNIYILGVRSSSALASFLGYYLALFFDNVHLVNANAASEIFEQIMRIGPDDAIIVISYPRYSSRSVKAAEFAKDKGSNVIAFTDSMSSPIVKYATHSLIAKSEMAYFVDSFVAPFSLANALIVSLGLKKRNEVYKSFEYLENIWEEYQVYEKM